jgi:translation initiation factor 2-alpha kinase 4
LEGKLRLRLCYNPNLTPLKKAEPSFTIRIKSSDEDIYLDLHVVLTATYPRSPPLLTIKNEEVLRDITKHKVQQVIKNLPKELLNEEQAMVMDIVVAIQEVLEEEAVAKAAGLEMPSLEEERLEKEEAAAKLAKAQEQEKEKKRQAKVIEEERMLQAMTQLEQERQRQSAKAARRSRISESKGLEVSLIEEDDESLKEIIKFDRPIKLIDEKNNPRHFVAVTGKYLIREGPAADCFTVRPILTGARSQLLVLKQTSLKMPSKDGGRFKMQMENLEKQLQSLKKVSGGHANILRLYDYKLNKDDRNKESIERIWTVYVLSEYANKGSLEECLEIAGDLGVDKVRSWTIELLEALGYLHNNGIIHRDLHAANIMLIRSPTGNFTAKIGDAGFQRYLHDMKDVKYGEKLAYAKSTSWIPPEHLNVTKRVYSQKSDIWDFGIIFLQMIFGLNVLKRYESPERLMEGSHLSQQLEEIVKKLFKIDPKKRPRAFDLTSSEFLATDAPIKANRPSYTLRRGSVPSLFGLSRGREDSMTQYRQESQYEREFNELGPLGKGGFGAVVKARKKTDGNVYAIKKISQKSTASLTEVLKEVRVLSQLSHPFVVRYYNSWTEEVRGEVSDTEGSTTAAGESSNAISPGTGLNVEFGYSTGGVDFISSSGYPAIEFAYGSDEEAVVFEDDDDQGQDEDEDTEGDDLDNSSAGSVHTETNPKQNRAIALRSEHSSVRIQRTSTMLFIQYVNPFSFSSLSRLPLLALWPRCSKDEFCLYSITNKTDRMEFCENRTLRDLIKNNLWRDSEEVWRLFRQIVDALAYVHKMNVVHRDLKPENVFIDGSSDIRLGDFGLATASQFNITDNATAATDPHNMTTSIGTASYVAPEVRSTVGNYNNKVDMYSLGIIFFEMCYHPVVGMERATVLTGLRKPNPIFPSDFNINQHASQGEIIRSLLSHNPDCRPGAAALLKSGKLPVPMGDELIRQTIAGMADPESAYFRTMLTSLFSEKNDAIKDGLWDGQNWPYAHSTLSDFIMRSIVKDQLKYIFKRHGALETPRPGILPYLPQSDDVVKLLDHNGMVVQLPYDLEVPYARMIAKYPVVPKSFAFGNVYRNRKQGQPLVHSQVNFDIVSDSLDLSLKEAEALKVIDEILAEFPCFGNTKMCFHVNHADLLSLILQFCRVEEDHRPAAARELSYLNFRGKTWLKTKPDLKAIGLSETSLDDLRAFDFRGMSQAL